MKISSREKNGYYFIEAGENFNIKSLLKIKEAIDQGFELGYSVFVFDMSICLHMDSSSVGLIANLYKKCSLNNGKIGFLKPTKEIVELIEIASLSSIINIYNSEDEISGN